MKTNELLFSYSRDRIMNDVVDVAEKRLLESYLEIERVANSEKFKQSLQLKFTSEEERIKRIGEIKEKQFKLTVEQLINKIASNAKAELDGEMKSLDLSIATKEFTEQVLKEILPAYEEISKRPVEQETIQHFKTNIRKALGVITNATIVPKNKI